ncbi:MAG: hypothetical protein A3I72_14350 [Candidatus Tectomicrobia bacterium RIFCSPLOWO2_02_FULL_70_19]|nr:MAG: hypothetical protein A3I72_14350 [Candidatus Tectomicrobia bacterium RIFCSPLOWO2_02_FULL_70_19]
MIQPSGPRPVVPGKPAEGLKMGPKPSEEATSAQKERCDRASYIVRQANELGDESPLTVTYVQRALDICPNNPAANVRMGIIQFNQKNPSGARKSFQQALRDGAHLPEVHYNLGVLSWKEKKDAEALTHFRRAVELDPGGAAALYNLGVTQARAQERGQAVDSFQNAIRANPRMAEAHFFLGALLQEQGQREPARKALQESVRLNAKLALPHIYLAAIFEAEGRPQAAQEELKLALRLNPASVQVGYSLDDFYAKEGGSNEFLSRVQERAKSEGPTAAAPPPEGKSPPGGGKTPAEGFGPRREAREVPVAGKKPEAPPREKSPAPPARREAAAAPRPEPARPAPRERPASPAPRREPPGRTYRVRAGDTLSTIAARHGTSLAVLARMNRERIEHPSLIEPGQEILVPAPPRARATNDRRPPAKSTASRPSSAQAPRRTPAPPREPFRIHRVQRGETLARIAKRYGTTVATLVRLNRDRIEHPSLIQAGQSIRVPAPRAARSAPKPAAKAPPKPGPSPREVSPKPPAPAPAAPSAPPSR